MSLIDFIRTVEESADDFDVELEEFDPDSEQAQIEEESSGGRSIGRIFVAVALLAAVAYVVYRFRSAASSDDESFTDINLDDIEDDATVTVEYDAEEESADEASEIDVIPDESDEETKEADSDDEGVEVEIEGPGNDETDEE